MISRAKAFAFSSPIGQRRSAFTLKATFDNDFGPANASATAIGCCAGKKPSANSDRSRIAWGGRSKALSKLVRRFSPETDLSRSSAFHASTTAATCKQASITIHHGNSSATLSHTPGQIARKIKGEPAQAEQADDIELGDRRRAPDQNPCATLQVSRPQQLPDKGIDPLRPRARLGPREFKQDRRRQMP